MKRFCLYLLRWQLSTPILAYSDSLVGLPGRVGSSGGSEFNWRNHILLGRQVDIQTYQKAKGVVRILLKIVVRILFKKER